MCSDTVLRWFHGQGQIWAQLQECGSGPIHKHGLRLQHEECTVLLLFSTKLRVDITAQVLEVWIQRDVLDSLDQFMTRLCEITKFILIHVHQECRDHKCAL